MHPTARQHLSELELRSGGCSGTSSGSSSSKSYWGYGGGPITYSTSTYKFPISLSTTQGIWIRSQYFLTSSDRRIKKEITDLDDLECLNKLLLLKPCKYRHKDYINRGERETYGFIAQEVEEILPEAVKTTNNYLPNIYKRGKYYDKVITIDEDFEYTPVVGDEVKIYDINDEEVNTKIVAVYNNKCFKIEDEIKTDNVFVFGSKVEDFKTLIKEFFHPLAISSIQEHHRMIMEQKQEISELKSTIASIMTRLETSGL